MARQDAINRTLKLFKMMSNHTRLRIMALLVEGEHCVQDICARLEMSQPAISHQLKHLRDFGVVKTRRDGKHIYYSMKDEQVKRLFLVGNNRADYPHREERH